MLDGEKRKVMTVASNPGHLLWSGIVPPDRAARVVARLMAPDMNSGWGIRTLSTQHPAYNPYSYQNGSVWPHDNSLIALGFKRYGFAKEAAQVAHDISEAASYFLLNQLPELYAGVERAGATFPIQYLGANVPQAWAAGSCFALLQAMLGIQPDAPNDRLYVDPDLPAWLPDVTLMDLRVGHHTLDIRFRRDDGRTVWDVLKGDGKIVALSQRGGRACRVADRVTTKADGRHRRRTAARSRPGPCHRAWPGRSAFDQTDLYAGQEAPRLPAHARS